MRGDMDAYFVMGEYPESIVDHTPGAPCVSPNLVGAERAELRGRPRL
jgi:hypothetical protein